MIKEQEIMHKNKGNNGDTGYKWVRNTYIIANGAPVHQLHKMSGDLPPSILEASWQPCRVTGSDTHRGIAIEKGDLKMQSLECPCLFYLV